MSMEEEEEGVKATWKEFDAALWLAAFGSEEDLVKIVANPSEFMQQREGVVIGFSDQIPVWVKIGRAKQVYCGDEVKKRKSTEDFKEMHKKKQATLKDVEKNKMKKRTRRLQRAMKKSTGRLQRKLTRTQMKKLKLTFRSCWLKTSMRSLKTKTWSKRS